MYSAVLRSTLLTTLMIFGLALPVFAGDPTLAELVDAFKTNMAESQTVLRQYEWTETTVVTLDGNEVSRKRHGCYYDANGNFLREPLSPQGKRFERGMLPPDEKEQLTDYMQAAVKLLRQYIPLNPSGIQAARLTGGLVFKVTEPGRRGLLTISNFLLAGDRMVLDLDLATNRPLSVNIDSYLDNQNEPVSLAVSFGSLYGTASFARETVLEAKGKKLRIAIQTSDYYKP